MTDSDGRATSDKGSGSAGSTGSTGSSGPTDASGPPLAEQPRGRGVGVLLPAIALVVGLVAGGLFVGLTDLGGSGDTTSQGPTSTSSTSPASSSSSSTPADVVITVPGACLSLTDDSQELLDLVDQAATAARDLDAAALSSVVSKLQDAQSQLRTQTDACRTAATTSN